MSACPLPRNVYFDNVQGEVLDTCLEHLAKGGRVAMCGGVSVLNEGGGRASYNLMRVVWKRARLQGFSIFDIPSRSGMKRSSNSGNGSGRVDFAS